MDNKKEYTVLLVDDEKGNLLVLADILSSKYNILMAKSGARAVEIAESQSPDLIVMDVLMPEMSGFDTIKKLKTSPITVKTPVIFITGLSDAESEEKGLLLGAVDYIVKPFNRAIVKARVDTHIKIVDQMRVIERLCFIDPLTKIANRRGFTNRLDAEWSRAQRNKTPLSVFMLDIDRFKVYNDTYGHPQGDVALQTVAQALTETLKRSSDFAARWGGEEFIGLFPSLDNAQHAWEIAEQIRKNIEALVIPTCEGKDTSITVSIGIHTVIPTPYITPDEIIKKADDALYRAKANGRNRVELAEG